MIPDKELINNNVVVENNENKNIIENVISESTDELVECSDNEILMCIDEVEREWKNNIVVECGQRLSLIHI